MFYTSVSQYLARMTFGSFVTKLPLPKIKLVPVGTRAAELNVCLGRRKKWQMKSFSMLNLFLS